VDETYVEISNQTHIGLLAAWPNLAIAGSFSKVPGLAGLRLGYIAASAEIAAVVRRILPPYPVNVAAAAAALAYLEDSKASDDFVKHYRIAVASSLTAIAAACRPVARNVFVGAANFVLVDFGARVEAAMVAFERRSIRTRAFPGSELFQMLRITAQNASGTAAICDALAELAPVNAADGAGATRELADA